MLPERLKVKLNQWRDCVCLDKRTLAFRMETCHSERAAPDCEQGVGGQRPPAFLHSVSRAGGQILRQAARLSDT